MSSFPVFQNTKLTIKMGKTNKTIYKDTSEETKKKERIN